MAVPLVEQQREDPTDRYPLLMESEANRSGHDHVIDITRGNFPSSSGSHQDDPNDSDGLNHEERPSTSTQIPVSQSSSSSTSSNARNAAFIRRGDGYGRRHRSPLNSGLWISIELLVNVSQIIAAIIVLSLSRNENPKAPLFEWVIGYTVGCFATLPHLYWRYIHRNNQGTDQESTQAHQGFQNNPSETAPYTAVSVVQIPDGEGQGAGANSSNGQDSVTVNPRVIALVDHFKMALDCFFAVWFVVGNVWIFGGHSSASDAPNLYRLCIVFLTFSCIGYAMPFILCATICCCLPCIISILGLREDLSQNRGATTELLNSLPTYKFRSKRTRNRDDSETNSEGMGEGGIFAAGTDKERMISAEDADLSQNRGATTELLNSLPTYKFRSKRTRNRDDSETNSEGMGEGGIFAAGTDKERMISAEDADLSQNRGATTELLNSLPTYKFRSKRTRNRDDSETNSEGMGEGGIFAAGTDKERMISAEDADLSQNRGATTELLNSLPTYKFRSKRTRNRDDSETNSEGMGEGGIFAAGTDKERMISAEDAVCCICLAKYADNDELRELPCAHFFHKDCVDKWLKINALCPLCKAEVGEPAGLASGGRG